jgi:hypothetical protein
VTGERGVANPCGRLRSWQAIREAVGLGLRGLASRHRSLVTDGHRFSCSVDLDEARRVAEPEASRWDYILGLGADAWGMEVHPAKASEVDGIIRKKLWAADRLSCNCGLRVSRWHWVRPSGSPLQFTQRSPEAHRLAKYGIRFPTARL